MSDSDWAGCVSTRQSRSGNCAILSNCVIDYYSKMQGLISSSSCEAETEAAVQGMKTLVHLRILLHELGYFQRGSTKLYGDNMATVLNSNSRKQSPRSKAFQIRTELLRAVTRSGRGHMVKIPTTENLSDLYTKQPSISTFTYLRDCNMGLTDPQARSMCSCLDGISAQHVEEERNTEQNQISGVKKVVSIDLPEYNVAISMSRSDKFVYS